ncbi:MAG: hypothetical protein S4CHLAM37_12660 [Chlamydiia bacterium]|nr:hypothetical protein [Chlamydiia bacterium]
MHPRLCPMKKESEEEAVNIPTHSEREYVDPSEICNTLRVRILCFIMDIEELINKPETADNPAFLDKLSADISAMNSLSDCAGSCTRNIMDAGRIINAVLTCPIDIKDTGMQITTLDAALKYRENKEFYDIFSTILKAYQEQKEESETLLNELKILAFDLTGEA